MATMETSNNPVEVLTDELRRFNLFYSFWDLRIEIESNYIRALKSLIFEVPGPAGSLKDALDALNALVRIEIDQRTGTLNMLCDLRGDRKDSTPPFRGREYISSWLTSAASDLQKRIVDLAKRKAGLTSLEETAEKATLTRTEEPIKDNPSTMTRLLLGRRKSRPSPNKTSPVILPPSFTQFDQADHQYRDSVVRYNYLRRQYLGESLQRAEEWVTNEFEFAAMIQKMISAFADSQSDLASALNHCSSRCRLVVDHISPSTESNDFLVRLQNGISAEFGQRYFYKNFWFGVGDNGRLPTILFGRPIPISNLKNPTVIKVFDVLAKHTPLLSFSPSEDLSEEESEQLSKSAHELETHWEHEEVDGGREVRRLLTAHPVCQKLLLHFLVHMPEPLMNLSRPGLFYEAPVLVRLKFICDRCNDGSYFKRKMLSTTLHLLADSSKNEGGVQWAWWDQDDRGKHWGRVLTRETASIDWFNQSVQRDTMGYLLRLWVHCFEYLETDEFLFLRAKLDRLDQSWGEWVGNRAPSMLAILSGVQ